jgi:hypothetical protein
MQVWDTWPVVVRIALSYHQTAGACSSPYPGLGLASMGKVINEQSKVKLQDYVS